MTLYCQNNYEYILSSIINYDIVWNYLKTNYKIKYIKMLSMLLKPYELKKNMCE